MLTERLLAVSFPLPYATLVQSPIVGRAHRLAGNQHSFGCGFSSVRMAICSRRSRTAAVRIRSTTG